MVSKTLFAQVLLDNAFLCNIRRVFMPCSSFNSVEKLRGRKEHKQTTEQFVECSQISFDTSW